MRIERQLRAWLGPRAVVQAGPIDPAHIQALDPQELAVVRSAVLKRRAEFATARVLARRALAQLGAQVQALLPQPDRAPRWPSGVVGSISHTDHQAVVAVGWADELVGLGLDLECARPFNAGMANMVLTPAEHSMAQSCAPKQQQRRYLETFCGKEAFYKFQSPQTGIFLDFQQVEIVWHAGAAWLQPASPEDPVMQEVCAKLGARRWSLQVAWLDEQRVLSLVCGPLK